ncbi:MAG: hypothetical protein AB1664_03805 [Thermodesulfobacteriota bacterium]
MNEETELRETLYQGTLLVAQVLSGRISLQEFVQQYDSFYYYNALDGHEADAQRRSVLQKYSKAIGFHEAIQTTVVDLIYLGHASHRAQYLAAGRIDSKEAIERIGTIAESHSMSGILSDLQD